MRLSVCYYSCLNLLLDPHIALLSLYDLKFIIHFQYCNPFLIQACLNAKFDVVDESGRKSVDAHVPDVVCLIAYSSRASGNDFPYQGTQVDIDA